MLSRALDMALLRALPLRIAIARSKPSPSQSRAFADEKKPPPAADDAFGGFSFREFLGEQAAAPGASSPSAIAAPKEQEFSLRDFLKDSDAFPTKGSRQRPRPQQQQQEGFFFGEKLPSSWSSDASEDSSFSFGRSRPGDGASGVDSEGSGFSFKSIMQSSGELDLSSVRKAPEKKLAEEEEDSIFDSPSFQVLRDSLFEKSKPKQQGFQGSMVDTDWFSVVQKSTKPPETSLPRTSESSSFFTSTVKRTPAINTYSYEELGERLRMLRPPLDKISSAAGFSFRELGERLQKMRSMEEIGGQTQISESFQELKDSLQLLSRKARPSTQLHQGPSLPSLRELDVMNRTGANEVVAPQITYLPPKEDLLEKYFSVEQMSSKELLKLEIRRLIKEFQIHETDTGTSQVQIAILTAKINNLQRHFGENHNYKRDKHSRRGLNGMIQDRKRLLWYLRRRDWDAYCNVLTKLKLRDIIHEKLKSRYK